MKHKFGLLLLAGLLVLGAGVGAEVRTFRKVVRQVMGNSMSKDDARTAAISRARLEVLQEAGAYLESLAVVKSYELQKDKTLALATGVLHAVIVKKEPFRQRGVSGIRVVAEVKVNISALETQIRALVDDRHHLDDLQASQRRVAELLKRVKALEAKNTKLAATATAKKKKSLRASIRDTIQKLRAQEWFQKGLDTDSPTRQVEYFDKAIKLDSKSARAYGNRGFAYFGLTQYRRAIEDYNRAVKLDPKLAITYRNRGIAHARLGQQRRAIEDYNRALELDPNSESTYGNRGNAYTELNQFHKAIEDYNRALELDPQLAQAYNNRALAYAKLGQFHRGLEDANRAIELNPELAVAYRSRGELNYTLKKPEKACRDWRRGCDLGNKVACKHSNTYC